MKTGKTKDTKIIHRPPANSHLHADERSISARPVKLFIRGVREEEFPIAVVQRPFTDFPMHQRHRGWGINE
ncbi:MAG TPA: hypothetical protein VH597_14180 [Verrucomicrobiae bacterium]|jgi:hypothetical protein|nr:hypothetical protein [Verrucomicrobiae bacterium]